MACSCQKNKAERNAKREQQRLVRQQLREQRLAQTVQTKAKSNATVRS